MTGKPPERRDAGGGNNDAGPPRAASIDATRGLLLLVVLSGSLGVRYLSHPQTGSAADAPAGTAWDLLVPGFLFLAGVALSHAAAGRQGQAWPMQLLRAARRAAVLVLLGVYVDSYFLGRPSLQLRGDLQVIGLATLMAFLVQPLGLRVHALCAGFLLAGHTAAHLVYRGATGVDAWSAGHTLGLSLTPTLAVGPSADPPVSLHLLNATATVLLGLLAGELLRAPLSTPRKLLVLGGAGLGGVVAGWLLGGGGVWVPVTFPTLLPVVPRLGSLSFVLPAAGWLSLLLALVYALTDVCNLRRFALPLVVLGANSLVVYLAYAFFREWAARTASLPLPTQDTMISPYRVALVEVLAVVPFWLLAGWLYRKGHFIRA